MKLIDTSLQQDHILTRVCSAMALASASASVDTRADTLRRDNTQSYNTFFAPIRCLSHAKPCVKHASVWPIRGHRGRSAALWNRLRPGENAMENASRNRRALHHGQGA